MAILPFKRNSRSLVPRRKKYGVVKVKGSTELTQVLDPRLSTGTDLKVYREGDFMILRGPHVGPYKTEQVTFKLSKEAAFQLGLVLMTETR